MKEIKICWLYNELLDLYGDGGNISAITYQLRCNNIPYIVDHKGIYDPIDFSAYDLFYMGPGKDRNIIEAGKNILKYKSEIVGAIEAGKVFLIIGNAQLLFGETFDDGSQNYPGLGIFKYKGKMTGKVFINDYICQSKVCDEKVYGFINRTSEIDNVDEEPLFEVIYSQNNIGKYEGRHRHNYFSTWALGPLLAKNPALLKTILSLLIPNETIVMNDELMNEAYRKTMKEFDL